MRKILKSRKNIIIIIALLVLIISVSLAYVIAQFSNGTIGNIKITADTADNLQFSVDKDINLNPTQFNVPEGGGGLSDTAVGTATLLANSTNKTATYDYYVYFNIKSNDYTYTTEEQKPEIVLTITAPTGEAVTSIEGLAYVTVQNADGSEVKGFDITTKSGLFNVASLYEITANSSTDATIQDWTFTVTFINLTTNQAANGGSTLDAEILLRKDEYKQTLANYIIDTVYTGVDGENGLYYHDGISTSGICKFNNNIVYSSIDYMKSQELKIANSYYGCQKVYQISMDGNMIYLDNSAGDYIINVGQVIWDSSSNTCKTLTGNNTVVNIKLQSVTEEECVGDAFYINTSEVYVIGMIEKGTGSFEFKNEIIEESFEAGDNSYRYAGANPNNYVCFGSNEETCPEDNLYRIIGIFDDKIKLIKFKYATNNLLGNDGNFHNNVYLSEDIYKEAGFPNVNSIIEWLYVGNLSQFYWNNSLNLWEDSTLNLVNLNKNYLNNIGDSWNNKIASVKWQVGGIDTVDNAKTIYDYEVGIYASNNTYNAKIGLMYISDFYYASNPEYWENDCTPLGSNWLNFKALQEWTITPYLNDNKSVFMITLKSENNNLYSSAVRSEVSYYELMGVRPVFYLKDSIIYNGGIGSIDDPYRIY